MSTDDGMSIDESGYQALIDAEADAEGEVRIAEVRLSEIRRDPANTGGLDPDLPSSATVTAEEELASAVRRLQRCRVATVTAKSGAATSPAGEDGDGAADGAGDYSARIMPDRVLQYTNAADWVEQYLLRMWRRQNVRWCAKWFLHGEALTRLEALWRSWEYLRYEGPTAMAVWWRDYADYHLRELTAPAGPFERCNHRTGEHELIQMLTVEPAPQELRQSAEPAPTGPAAR